MARGKTDKARGKKEDRISRILKWLYHAFIILIAAILFRIVQIQATYEPDPKISAYFHPRSTKVTLEPMRGAILARDGRPFAISTPMYQIYMDCTVMKEPVTKDDSDEKAEQKRKNEREWREKARALAGGLANVYGDKTAEQYLSLILSSRERGAKYVKIGSPIDHETLQTVQSLPLFCEGAYRGGMIVEKRDTRQYPYGTLARRTIGYVKDNSKSNGNNMIGIEGKFNYILHGEEGYEWMRVTDNRGNIHNFDSTWAAAKDGHDIRTTLDVDIQDIAETALRRNIEENPKIEGGCVIVMDVATGGIRAMVNLLRDSVTKKMNESYNMAIGRPGEPGSVFKSTTLMTLLEDGKVSLNTNIPTNHGYVKGFTTDNHIIDYERENKTNQISVLHGFEISSNYVFRYLAVDNYGNEPKKMVEKLYQYKLGEAYDFDLDGFKSPTIPSPDSPSWSATDLGSIAIGYSVAETPLHIATFYNAIANKGKMMKPYIVEDIEENGTVVYGEIGGPSVLSGSICSRTTADSLTKALSRVTEVGTGRTRLKGAKCKVAGKTGTARIVLDPKYTKISHNPYEDEKGRRQYQATFVGFFPAEAPRYTAIVVIYSNLDREIFYGGTLPAMTFREIVDNVWAMDDGAGETLTEKVATPEWMRKTDQQK